MCLKAQSGGGTSLPLHSVRDEVQRVAAEQWTAGPEEGSGQTENSPDIRSC